MFLMKERHWLFWDGECAFCQRCAQWVQQRDSAQRFIIMPYQQAPAPPMDERLRAACQHAVQVVRADGVVLGGGVAVLFVLEQLGYRWARLFRHKPLVFGVEWLYRWVARHRSWFGSRCQLH